MRKAKTGKGCDGHRNPSFLRALRLGDENGDTPLFFELRGDVTNRANNRRFWA